ncbi:MAG: hypothetical protein WBN40_04110 [Pseudomonadales bacterium]
MVVIDAGRFIVCISAKQRINMYRASEGWSTVVCQSCIALLLLVLATAVAAKEVGTASAIEFKQTSGSFLFTDWQGKPLDVHYALPVPVTALKNDTPVLFVMTGRKRNAADYRDQWQALAEKYGFIVLAPEFTWSQYPDEVSYDMGNVFSFRDRLSVPDPKVIKLNPEKKWALSAIEPIFDVVSRSLALTADAYSMYGHSSGAGFVHRYLYYKPDARVAHAVAANGAWYLLPISEFNYPYGLKGSKINKRMLNIAFRRDLTIMFGQDDLGPRKQFHANTKEANAQGPHVVSRAMNYLLISLLAAKQLDMTNNWKIRSVPNVGHSNTKIAPHAVEHLFPELYYRAAAPQ